ncbi:MAG: hypothetical protein ACPH5V_02650 [Alcanivorax sp.]
MFIPIRGFGKHGVIHDTKAASLPIGTWKDALNMRFSGRAMEKMLEPSKEMNFDPSLLVCFRTEIDGDGVDLNFRIYVDTPSPNTGGPGLTLTGNEDSSTQAPYNCDYAFRVGNSNLGAQAFPALQAMKGEHTLMFFVRKTGPDPFLFTSSSPHQDNPGSPGPYYSGHWIFAEGSDLKLNAGNAGGVHSGNRKSYIIPGFFDSVWNDTEWHHFAVTLNKCFYQNVYFDGVLVPGLALDEDVTNGSGSADRIDYFTGHPTRFNSGLTTSVNDPLSNANDWGEVADYRGYGAQISESRIKSISDGLT